MCCLKKTSIYNFSRFIKGFEGSPCSDSSPSKGDPSMHSLRSFSRDDSNRWVGRRAAQLNTLCQSLDLMRRLLNKLRHCHPEQRHQSGSAGVGVEGST